MVNFQIPKTLRNQTFEQPYQCNVTIAIGKNRNFYDLQKMSKKTFGIGIFENSANICRYVLLYEFTIF